MLAAGGRMRPCWALLLLLLLGLAGAAAPEPWTASYADAETASTALLNAKAASPHVPRRAQPRPGSLGSLRRPQELGFLVEETTTTCGSPGAAAGTGRSGTRRSGPLRRRRSKIRDFFAKIKKGIKDLVECGKLWARDKLDCRRIQP